MWLSLMVEIPVFTILYLVRLYELFYASVKNCHTGFIIGVLSRQLNRKKNKQNRVPFNSVLKCIRGQNITWIRGGTKILLVCAPVLWDIIFENFPSFPFRWTDSQITANVKASINSILKNIFEQLQFSKSLMTAKGMVFNNLSLIDNVMLRFLYKLCIIYEVYLKTCHPHLNLYMVSGI